MKSILRQFIRAIFYKFTSILVVMVVPTLILKDISFQEYGRWSLFQSLIFWIFLFDLGVGNSLQNNLCDNRLSREEKDKYITLAIGISIIVGVFLSVTSFTIFMASSGYNVTLIGLGFACLITPLNLVNKIYIANGKSDFVELVQAISSILFLVMYFLCKSLKVIGLDNLVYIYVLSFFIPRIVCFVKISEIRRCVKRVFSFDIWRTSIVRGFINSSFSFFSAQILFLMIYSSARYILAFFSSIEVAAQYDLAMRPFSMLLMLSVLILRPLWAEFSNKFSSDDLEWCNNSYKKIVIIYLVFMTIALSFFPFLKKLYFYWLKANAPEVGILYSVGLFTFVNIWQNISAYIMNGIGIIKNQIVLNSVGVAIYLFVLVFLYVSGHILDPVYYIILSILPMLPMVIVAPILINKKFKKIEHDL